MESLSSTRGNMIREAQLKTDAENVLAQQKNQKEIQTKDSVHTLAQAKDRAQLIATTAMSIVNVALLKELLSEDGEHGKFYWPLVTLVSLSLALQVLIGVVQLSISHIRDYYEKYGDDFCGDCLRHVFFLRLVFKDRHRKRRQSSEADDGCCSCMPCYLTTATNQPYEYNALQAYEDWEEKALDKETNASKTRIEQEYAELAANNASQQLAKLKELMNAKLIDQEEYARKKQKPDATLFKTFEKEVEYIKARKELEIHRDEGAIVNRMVEDIRRDRVLKKVSFWQNIINYMLYCVFIFNVFITGLGAFGHRVKK